MWLAFVMAITPVTAVASDGRGMIGPFKTEIECMNYLEMARTSPADYCAVLLEGPASRHTSAAENLGKLD